MFKIKPSYDYFDSDQVKISTNNKFLMWLGGLWFKLQGYKMVDRFTEPDRTIQTQR